jgi:hypothetical protein
MSILGGMAEIARELLAGTDARIEGDENGFEVYPPRPATRGLEVTHEDGQGLTVVAHETEVYWDTPEDGGLPSYAYADEIGRADVAQRGFDPDEFVRDALAKAGFLS